MDDPRRERMMATHKRIEPQLAALIIDILGTEGERDPDAMSDVLRVMSVCLAQHAGMMVSTAAGQGHVNDTGRAAIAGIAARELLRVAQIDAGQAAPFDFRTMMGQPR